DDVVADGLHVERYVAVRQLVINKKTLGRAFFLSRRVCIRVSSRESDALECVVINIDARFGEIGHIEISLAIDKSTCEASICGTIICLDQCYGVSRRRRSPLSQSNVWIPTGNCPVSGAEEENRRLAWC